MILYAAVDLRGGKAVQLVGGRTEAQKVELPDPVRVALDWVSAGFQALHVIDLDAAFGHGDNHSVIGEILTAVDVPVQVGGGVRSDDAVDELLDAGAARVIVGTRAIEDRAWLADLTRRRGGAAIVVAADVRDHVIVTRGWTEATQLQASDFLSELNQLELGGVLITDVGREGGLGGVDVATFEKFVKQSSHPVLAAGGIRDLDDLTELDRVGVDGAVLGMSIYTGAIDARAATAKFL